ncbi:hypothetical protein ACGFIF_33720 [Kribbella sp. NPDC049174]|uniref:hypothetical protein n=1 Tax=Kribbella sp. NPDC049174 TaxID=3364112 RepID=UPI0037121BA9
MTTRKRPLAAVVAAVAVAYVRGRTVLGGVGTPVKVPGTVAIEAAAHLWDTTLTVQVASATSSSLVIQDYTGKVVDRFKGVDSLATSADGKYAAYASGGRYSLGEAGGKVYFQEPGTRPTAVLARPKAYDLRVIAVIDRFVYFRSARSAGPAPNGGEPYGEPRTAALDTKTGKLLREWTAKSLRGAVAEDDDHLLLLWPDRQEPQSRSAVVRCTVSTGQCELATPLSPEPLLLGS